jgi:hypothetical protein
LGHFIIELVVVLEYLRQLVRPYVFVQSLLRKLLDQYLTEQQEIKVAALAYDLELLVELVLGTGHQVTGDGEEDKLADEGLL